MIALVTEIRWVPTTRWDRHIAFATSLLAAYALLLGCGILIDRAIGSKFTVGLFRHLTDIPCPLCRGSRAADALAHADLVGAVFWNPLATVLLISSGFWFIIRFGLARRLELRLTRTGKRTLWTVAGALVLANWTYVIAMGG